MSELIQTNDTHATIRWKLLAGVSALALSAYISSASAATAEDADRPLIWLQFSGGAELLQGTSTAFSAPFMFPAVPPPDHVYGTESFGQKQAPPRFAFSGESKIIFQPEDSDWLFSASVRYGRSHGRRHDHYQGPQLEHILTSHGVSRAFPKYAAAFSDTLASHDEHHTMLEFAAGKDVGLGVFGHDGVSTISIGARVVQVTAKTSTTIYARPSVHLVGVNGVTYPQYVLTGDAARSFRGIGPSLSWNASAELAGNSHDRGMMLDWGIDGAVLFGRQKAKIEHSTSAYHFLGSKPKGHRIVALYPPQSASSTRSRRVTAPDISAFAAISFRLPHSKISFGYRAEVLMNAFDRGIDTAKKSNLTFNGPYASISIGLGD